MSDGSNEDESSQTEATVAPGDLARERTRQIFQFLKAFALRNVPAPRQLSSYEWHLPLRTLPKHPDIERGEVELAQSGSSTPDPTSDGAGEDALLTIRRPKVTAPPSPPALLLDWLEGDWTDPAVRPEVRPTRNVRRMLETGTEIFSDDPLRVNALTQWRTRWDIWAEAERPARAALKVFEQFYGLRARLERESERLELILSDGRLVWATGAGPVDHPILLQRVELEFDPSGPEIRLVDADRAPELYTAILQHNSGIAPQELNRLRADLVQRGYHPFEEPATTEFFRHLVQGLAARGEFHDKWVQREPRDEPHLSRDPVLLLRVRQSGFAAAFDRVLEHLEQGGPVPVALSALVGVDTFPTDQATSPWTSPWNEPPDIFLSKPANEQQVQIAQALERYRAVLVQGPPGTGKSHTIANLIGHLVASGRRVLITSHTTKALRVLRGHVPEALRPLCVAVLEKDVESRSQMEDAVRGILSRLTGTNEATLEREVADFSSTRVHLLEKVEKCTDELRLVRENEYRNIVVAAEATAPAEAARWVQEHVAQHAWIPRPVELGAPLPLSVLELRELYGTNEQLTRDEEEELGAALPELDRLLSRSNFEELTGRYFGTPPESDTRWWERAATEEEIPSLAGFDDAVTNMATALTRFVPWQRSVIAAGHGDVDVEAWYKLRQIVNEWHSVWVRTREEQLEYDCFVDSSIPLEKAKAVARDVRAHLDAGGTLSPLALLFRGTWKEVLRGIRVNGVQPATVPQFRAVQSWLTLQEQRLLAEQRWKRQAEPIGLPSVSSLPKPVEPVIHEYVDQFPILLSWWSQRWVELQTRMADAGFRYDEYRRADVAAHDASAPFDRDSRILENGFKCEVSARLNLARRAQAQRVLRELDEYLSRFTGPVSAALRVAVRRGNPDAYEAAITNLRMLIGKRSIAVRRVELLGLLQKSALGWADAIRMRTPPHDSRDAPGDAALAWRWRQFSEELNRRAGLDEIVLMKRLHQLRTDLRNTTVELIDRRAWLGQVRRVDLAARQALQGWANIQRRIGKGTGKRVPELQAEARRLLSKARDAVPVWIMPLNRVAESMDLSRGRFDVVIVDEASQSDVQGLLAWYLGDRVAIVGDHEQVSPLAVGQRIEDTTALIAQHLDGVPNAILYDGRTSIYDLARQSFGGVIALREHFRCVPDIIEFSNHLSYNGEIRPLRDPSQVAQPHVVECIAESRYGKLREGKTNQAEARLIVALIKAMTLMPEYRGRSFGAISLLGEDQADLIQRLAVEEIGAVELDGRHFVAGIASQFQGDERDVMLLSMVDSPQDGVLRMTQNEPTKQRYNVAASRARDQLWLVHSLDPSRDLQAGDLRRQLIDHVRDPKARSRKIETLNAKAESPFEQEVIRHLVTAGYEIEPQVWVGGYRLDMVVRGGGQQVAVECDGDRYHGFDQIPADLARQAILERVGWRFVRIRGTRYYRDPDGTMEEVRQQLLGLGVAPSAESTGPANLGTEAAELRDRVVRGAWDFMRTRDWLVTGNTDDTESDDSAGALGTT